MPSYKLVDKYQDRRLADRVFELDLDAQPGGAAAAQRTRAIATLRPPRELGDLRQRIAASAASILVRNVAGNPASGATPSPVTCRSCCCDCNASNIELFASLCKAHAYWRAQGAGPWIW